jgi:hypothetical protein
MKTFVWISSKNSASKFPNNLEPDKKRLHKFRENKHGLEGYSNGD